MPAQIVGDMVHARQLLEHSQAVRVRRSHSGLRDRKVISAREDAIRQVWDQPSMALPPQRREAEVA
jgi:hypothetical protein